MFRDTVAGAREESNPRSRSVSKRRPLSLGRPSRSLHRSVAKQLERSNSRVEVYAPDRAVVQWMTDVTLLATQFYKGQQALRPNAKRRARQGERQKK